MKDQHADPIGRVAFMRQPKVKIIMFIVEGNFAFSVLFAVNRFFIFICVVLIKKYEICKALNIKLH